MTITAQTLSDTAGTTGLDDRGGSTSDAENWFGLYRPDGSAKPAAAAMRAAIAALN